MGGWVTQYRLNLAEHYLKRETLQEWYQSGTINADCFGWLWEYLYPSTLADLFKF
jgi:hypothetical protein